LAQDGKEATIIRSALIFHPSNSQHHIAVLNADVPSKSHLFRQSYGWRRSGTVSCWL